MYECAYYGGVEYEWDEIKAETNRRKHDIRFADAVGVFEDEAAINREDPWSEGERRYVATGLDHLGRVLTVVYTHRSDAIRLISAREATARERRTYESHR